jgi:phosphoribosyl 1,2-cyclic phosphate phosphodiesterase
VKIRILGCGTSSGVPRIGNDWGSCDPAEPRNRRTRASILAAVGGETMLVDCGPDMRQQMLDAGVGDVDRVIVTHDHADHCHGIDDLRQLMHAKGAPVPLHARQHTIDRLRRRFGYAFEGVALYRPILDPVPITSAWDLGSARVRFVDQPHGGITSLGIRFEENNRSVAYSIDFHEMTGEMMALYEGLDLWVCDCLRHEPHPTHAHLDAVLGWARDLGVRQLLLSHLDKSMDYATLARELPDWAAPAFDGQKVELA